MKSEELRQQASEEDNDLIALGLHTKALREERSERVVQWLPSLREKCISVNYDDKQYCYLIEHSKYGVIKFYPKANKIFQVRKEKWIKPGLKWLVTNIIQQP